QSEALTSIDVNTGRFVGKRDLEETVLRTNLEAVKELVYQLRFRNIGGIIIIDLIDMESAENRSKVYGALQEALKQDKARTNILKISELGLVEMTRKRTRENLVQQLCEPCPNCEGRGYVLSSESMAYKILREIRKDLPRFCGRQIAISANPRVAEVLLARTHKACAELGRELGRAIEVRGQPGLHQEQFEVTALDSGPPVSIPLQWLGFPPETGDAKAPAADLPIRIDEPSIAAALGTSEPTDTAACPPESVLAPLGLEAPREAAEDEIRSSAAARGADDEKTAEPAAELGAAEDETAERATALTTAEGALGESTSAPDATSAKAARATSSPKRTPRKTAPAAANSKGTARESRPADATSEVAAPGDGSAAEPAMAASAEAVESARAGAAPAPVVEMLDLEPETPILPLPAKVEEP
ncbi:MAG TPA: ribonuclease E/G, partial [Myxococcota bacterium]